LSTAEDRRTPAPRVGALASIGDVRHEASRLYRAARRGEVAAADASRMANVLALIVRCLEGADLERRVEALEAAAAERQERRR
jgi:hypothetical protein